MICYQELGKTKHLRDVEKRVVVVVFKSVKSILIIKSYITGLYCTRNNSFTVNRPLKPSPAVFCPFPPVFISLYDLLSISFEMCDLGNVTL